jgi:3-methyladenine DNA glycosylase AlkD
MDRWCRDFDNWAICDTACFHLFDRTPHAWAKVAAWCQRREEFIRRAGFALLWALALHDKSAADELFLKCLPYAERAASDDRNFVKKAVNMAVRAIGVRNAALYAAARSLAGRLAESSNATERWVGKTTLRELNSPASQRRVAKKK